MIKGSVVALVTPFLESKKINYKKLKELIDFHLNNNTDGILLFGTTGEGSTLSLTEKYYISRYVIDYVDNRIPIILNVGSNSTSEVLKNIKKLEKLKPDAFLLITPYYNKTNEEGMYYHFKTAHDSTNISIIIYNVPSRTNIDMSISLIQRLSKLDRIIGIKEATKDINKLKELTNLQNDNFYWYSGNDERVIEDIKLGAKGLIGVCSNTHPKIVKKIIDLALNKKYDDSQRLFYKIKEYINVLNIDINPIPIKEAMNELKFNVGKYRLPLFETSLDNKNKIQKIIKEINL